MLLKANVLVTALEKPIILLLASPGSSGPTGPSAPECERVHMRASPP